MLEDCGYTNKELYDDYRAKQTQAWDDKENKKPEFKKAGRNLAIMVLELSIGLGIIFSIPHCFGDYSKQIQEIKIDNK